MKSYLILFLVLLLASSTEAMRNPAAVYCDTLGYQYTVEQTAGGDMGRCTLPNNVSVDSWSFLEGKSAQAYSYCKLNGYEMKTVENASSCVRFMTKSCAVCLLPDGTEKEVTALMGLTFQESTCGDGNCGYPEDSVSCPQDCEKKTGECAACQSAMSPQSYVIIGLALLAVVIIFLKLRKKKK